MKPEPPDARSKSPPENRYRAGTAARTPPGEDTGTWIEATRRDGVEAEERRWVVQAIARDPEAFRRLVDRHRDRAYALALRIVRDPQDAEEVAQDAFVRAWNALPGFRLEARFSTWLHRIVARRALDRSAQLEQRRAREAPIEAAIDAAAAKEAARDADAPRFERLIADLSDAQRAVVTLFYFEDQSVERVAEALDMPVGTVKTHLSRARHALREAWARGAEALR